MLTEEQIARLLGERDETHRLTSAERDRIRRVLEERTAAPADSEPPERPPEPDRVLVDVSSPPPANPRARNGSSSIRPRHRAGWLVAAAACVLALIGLAVTLAPSEDGPEVATGPAAGGTPIPGASQPTAVSSPDPRLEGAAVGAAFCAGPLVELTASLEAWNGVTNWTHLVIPTEGRNPEPHLPDQVRTVLVALGEILPNSATAEQIDALDTVTVPVGGFTPGDRARAEEVLTDAVAFVHDTIDADLQAGFVRFATCDLDGLGGQDDG